MRERQTAARSSLSTAAEVTAQRTVVLLPAASRSEAQKEVENTARILGRVEMYSGRSQGLEAETARLREEFENRRKAEEDPACLRTRIFEESLQRKSETSHSNAGILKRIDAYIDQSQAFEAETARLRKELENERAEKAAAFERIRVIEEKLRSGSEIAQKAEASQRRLLLNFRENERARILEEKLLKDYCYQALELQISEYKRREREATQMMSEIFERTNEALEAAGTETISTGAEDLTSLDHYVYAFHGMVERIEELPAAFNNSITCAGQELAEWVAEDILACVLSHCPNFPLDAVLQRTMEGDEVAIRGTVRLTAQELSRQFKWKVRPDMY